MSQTRQTSQLQQIVGYRRFDAYVWPTINGLLINEKNVLFDVKVIKFPSVLVLVLALTGYHMNGWTKNCCIETY